MPTEAASDTRRTFDHLKLRAARERLGWSRMDAAIAMGVGYPLLTKWECGYVDPTLRSTTLMARTLGLTVEELLVDP